MDFTLPHHRVVTRDADYADAVWDTYADRAAAATAWADAVHYRRAQVLDVFHQIDAATGEDEMVAKFADGFITLETCSCGGEECSEDPGFPANYATPADHEGIRDLLGGDNEIGSEGRA